MGFWDITILLLIPGLLLGMYAQYKVQHTYEHYAKIGTQRGMTGEAVARQMLDDHGLYDVPILAIDGELTDHYDPRAREVRLSQAVYHGNSIASLGIAAHEVGHALQHAKGYYPLHLRNLVIPMTNFSSYLYLPLLLLGMIFSYRPLVEIGIVLFAAIVLFQLITLPVEFNASRRAIATLGGEGILTADELGGAKSVLGAAALTYVAAAVTAVLQLLRLILIFGRR